LPHLDTANNLARGLIRSPADAEDIVQEACLRALQFFEIVRNTACYSWVKKNRRPNLSGEFDEIDFATLNWPLSIV
jgi:DNA-directed RNA polymerase specialized sigma24 family protein